MSNTYSSNRGQILVQVIVFASIVIYFVGAFASWASLNVRVARQALYREQAVQVAEAGIDYYRWHLAHAPTDFQDGLGVPGPYIHDYFDKDGNKIGEFTLTITPPLPGFSNVIISSEGSVLENSDVTRTVTVGMGKPSWADYSYISNEFVWFGPPEEVYGKLHTNNGVRVDGIAHNIVTTAVDQFISPEGGGLQYGVYTEAAPADPSPPTDPVPVRNDIFYGGRVFPIPAVDFTGLSSNLAQYKSDAQSGGRYFAGSGAQGYHLVLRTDDTFDMYVVDSLVPTPAGCTDYGALGFSSQVGWGTWSIQTETLQGNYPLPVNGIIFVEDHIWVDGQIQTARVTIASGRFPELPTTDTNIIVNRDLLYSSFNGTDVIGLIAQKKILIGLQSDDSLEIDAAAIAKNENFYRYFYGQDACGPRIRTTLIQKGMTASKTRGTTAWVDGSYTVTSGYMSQIAAYDANLLYGPPPGFPLTSDQYITYSWEAN